MSTDEDYKKTKSWKWSVSDMENKHDDFLIPMYGIWTAVT